MAMTKVATKVLFKPLTRPHRSLEDSPAPRGSAVIDWAAYIDGKRVVTETIADAVRLVRDGELAPSEDGTSGRFVWFGMHEPDAPGLEHLAEVFSLHPLAVQ